MPECNEIWYLGRTITCLKRLLNKTTEKLSIEQFTFEKIEN